MSKYDAVSQETKDVFAQVIENAKLTQYIAFDVVNDTKQKQVTKLGKVNPYAKYVAENAGKKIDMVIFVNEDIFWQLEDEQQIIVAEETLGGLSYNSEKDSIGNEKPDVSTYSGILRKYGAEKHEALRESIKTLYQVKDNQGEESGEVQVLDA